MTKEKEVTLEIRQAESADAALVIDFLNQVGKESDYMTLDETGIGMTLADMEHFLMVQEMSDNRICLLLFLDQELVALLNITAASKRSTQHIGDVFIVVQKAYWNRRTNHRCLSKLLNFSVSKECEAISFMLFFITKSLCWDSIWHIEQRL